MAQSSTRPAAAKPARKARPKKSAPAAKPVAAAPADDGIVTEPDWTQLLPDQDEQRVAREHWRRISGEMRDREILSASNGHALQRLVMCYLLYDRCSNAVAADGLVDEPNKDNPKAIARLSIHYKAMREAENTAERLEARLGISPGQRGKVAKVAKRQVRSAGADRFLGPAG